MDAGVTPWSELPLWVPEDWDGLKHVDFGRALAAGLKFRPLAETIRDTLKWEAARPVDTEWLAGLDQQREIELLHKWREFKMA